MDREPPGPRRVQLRGRARGRRGQRVAAKLVGKRSGTPWLLEFGTHQRRRVAME